MERGRGGSRSEVGRRLLVRNAAIFRPTPRWGRPEIARPGASCRVDLADLRGVRPRSHLKTTGAGRVADRASWGNLDARTRPRGARDAPKRGVLVGREPQRPLARGGCESLGIVVEPAYSLWRVDAPERCLDRAPAVNALFTAGAGATPGGSWGAAPRASRRAQAGSTGGALRVRLLAVEYGRG